MDLISLACKEVGLDLEHDSVIDDFIQVHEANGVHPKSISNETQDRLEQMTSKQLSFYGDLPNTVFTNHNGKQSTIILQNAEVPEPAVVVQPIAVASPISQLFTQSSVHKFHRRPRKSEIVNSLQGAPTRKLAELQSKSKTSESKRLKKAVIEVPNSAMVEVEIKEDNPFRYLLKDTEQGKVAFAFYVMNCWELQKDLPDSQANEEFVKQCSKWWTDLPTVYRRTYWTKETEYLKKMNCAKVRGRTWLSVNNNSDHMNINGNSVVKKESSKNKEDKSNVEYNIKVEEKENQESFQGNEISEGRKLRKRGKEVKPRKLLKAFTNFQCVHRNKLKEDYPDASKREIRRKLGIKWKKLDVQDKMKYYVKVSVDNVPKSKVKLECKSPDKASIEDSQNPMHDDADESLSDDCAAKSSSDHESPHCENLVSKSSASINQVHPINDGDSEVKSSILENEVKISLSDKDDKEALNDPDTTSRESEK